MKSKKKLLRILSWALGTVLTLLVIAGILILSFKRPLPLADVQVTDGAAFQSVLLKIYSSLTGPDGKMQEIASMTLTADEVNAILRNALRAYAAARKPDEMELAGVWRPDGMLRMEFQDPFAGPLVLRGTLALRPEYDGEKISLKAESGRIGLLVLPAFLLEKIGEDALKRLKDDENFRLIQSILVQLRVQENGGILVAFRPARIGMLLPLLLKR